MTIRLITLTLLAILASESRADGPPYDLVILGGRVVDGTGNAWFVGDLAVNGDTIERITPGGQLREAPARLKMNARGWSSRRASSTSRATRASQLLDGDGRVIGKVTQGVTTEILGEGTTNAPSHQVEEFDGPHGFDAWLRAMEQHGASINFGSFLGSATVRSYVKGMAQGPPTASELAT